MPRLSLKQEEYHLFRSALFTIPLKKIRTIIEHPQFLQTK